jgi:hypothetical protein
MKKFAKISSHVHNMDLSKVTSPLPMIFKGMAKKWPAVVGVDSPNKSISKWSDFSKLKERLIKHHGNEDSAIIVPVEFHGNYMHNKNSFQQHSVGFYNILDVLINEQQQLFNENDNITKKGETETETETEAESEGRQIMTKWFLAQHELKEVSPILLEDVIMSDVLDTMQICVQMIENEKVEDNGDEEKEQEQEQQSDKPRKAKFIPREKGKAPAIYWNNIWLGGHAGTLSPCHYDPFHNIFVSCVYVYCVYVYVCVYVCCVLCFVVRPLI